MNRISLDELETLRPEDDIPPDARVTVTAEELRALTGLIDHAREIQDVFGTLERPGQGTRP